MPQVKSYRDLEIWKLAVQLAIKVYKLSKEFPADEKFGLIAQIKDAVTSVSANIAESFGRFHYKDRVNFIYNSRGSLLEVESHLAVAKELGFIKSLKLYVEIQQDITILSIKINNFRTRLQSLYLKQ